MDKIKKYERRFGVEIEFHFKDGRSSTAARDLLKKGGFNSAEGYASTGKQYIVGHDGSGLEIKTPILCGKEGMKEFKAVMSLLKENGGISNTRDGLHVHHDAPEFRKDPALVLALVRAWFDHQGEIDKLVSTKRKGGYGSCANWTTKDMASLESWVAGKKNIVQYQEPYWDSTTGQYAYRTFKREAEYNFGRKALNISSLKKYGSIEIRKHEGTTDADIAEAWIKFGQSFLYDIIRRKTPMECVNDPELLMRRLQLPKKERETILAKSKKPVTAGLSY